MQYINAAYDVLKDELPRTTATRKTPSGYTKKETDGAWAQAGHSGGMPFRSDISNETFRDLNFCKKTAWEISGKPPCTKDNEYTIWNWDGNFFRGVFSVYAIPNKLFEVSKMMQEWDRWFNSVAVFFTKKDGSDRIYLVNLRGAEVNPPKEFEHASFNSNAGNDQSFVNYLRKNL